MSPELLLLLLRILLTVLLYGFLGMVGWLLWRDLDAQQRVQQARQPSIIARLVSLETDQSHLLAPITSIGRAATNTIVLSTATISSEHALITRRANQWWLQDLGSSNGTTLNQTLITSAVVVSSGDQIGFGSMLFRFELTMDT